MPRKSYKPEEIVAKLRQVDVLTSQGKNVAEAIRSIGISEVTYYRWRQEFGGFDRDQAKRSTVRESVFARRSPAVSGLRHKKQIVLETFRGMASATTAGAPGSGMVEDT